MFLIKKSERGPKHGSMAPIHDLKTVIAVFNPMFSRRRIGCAPDDGGA
jgi:hypothetical protein